MGSLEEPAPEVECASHPPKVLPCRHTFCLECLVSSLKSQPPDAIQCPLCRHCTRLPASGLPRLHNNLAILTCLPERMERACSVRFSRTEGQLWVWPQASCAAGRPHSHVSSISHSSEVGCLPRQEMWPRQAEQQGCWSLLHKPLCRIL
ncbi:potassium voltage-gated channel subfamily A member 5 [Platysternon megacephalum]|uniref:Potassium voltage-gated channel subfamily A member 5 n=1 Tax=Platysternon megacephalum TaxID=55544 RepID=A0A4D9DQR6_9SAUR|nr:potassium voltage-gated channel subfamily A member 5 [Platysternon megacephalum]